MSSLSFLDLRLHLCVTLWPVVDWEEAGEGVFVALDMMKATNLLVIPGVACR